MKLVVGLGNPGPQYALNRHNIGFMLADVLADRYAFKPPKRHGQSIITEGTIGESRVLLLKPLTFMNLSGRAVGEVSHFFKIAVEDICVIHDDLALPFGEIRVKQNGGHGGHNGLKSLDNTIGKAYWRLRIGIGHPGVKEAVVGYVLGNFSKAEQEGLIFLLRNIAEAFPLLLAKDSESFLKGIKLFTTQNTTP